MPDIEGIGEKYAKRILKDIRNEVEHNDLNKNRLPPWVKSASVNIAYSYGTFLINIKYNGSGNDDISFQNDTNTDIGLIFGILDGNPDRYFQELPNNPGKGLGPILMKGEYEEEGNVVIELSRSDSCFFQTKNSGYHDPLVINNVYFRIRNENTPVATSFVPMMIYLHIHELEEINSHLENFTQKIVEDLIYIHNTEQGNYYASKLTRKQNFTTQIDNSVIILGAYDDGKYEKELERVQDHLDAKGYEASLIKDLPGHPSRSIAHKVKTWTMSSKFCIVVDRESSGHLVEYSELKNEEVPIALLREENSGSTWMIGHEQFTDKWVELFEFQETPVEAADEATEWAEDLSEWLEDKYEDHYPSWKN